MKRIRPFWAVVAAACAAVVAASLVGSVATGMGWWSSGRGYIGDGLATRFMVTQGGVRYAKLKWTPAVGVSAPYQTLFAPPTPTAWIPRVWSANGMFEIVAPFWTVGVIALAGAAIAWRRMMRSRPGCCVQCNYNLEGLAGELCPEYGTACAQKSKERPA